MRIWIFLLLTLAMLEASFISTPVIEVQGNRASIEAPQLQKGMSGFIVRHFDATHSSIIANARVSETTPSSNKALITFSEFDGLRQNALPNGKWTPQANDEVIIAYDYGRALVIAPNEEIYNKVTKSIPNVDFVHPDLYATYLSHEGHPTPLVSDFRRFCTAASVGLLYIQNAQTLFTLDCKNYTLLQMTPYYAVGEESQTPFYTRVPAIRAAWWGEGSSRMDHYAPHYLETMALSNPKNRELYELYKAKFGKESALLRYFDLKE